MQLNLGQIFQLDAREKSIIKSDTLKLWGVLVLVSGWYATYYPWASHFIPPKIAFVIVAVFGFLGVVLRFRPQIQAVSDVVIGDATLAEAADIFLKGIVPAQSAAQTQVAAVQTTTTAIVKEASDAIAAAPVPAAPIPTSDLSAFDAGVNELRDAAPAIDTGFAP